MLPYKRHMERRRAQLLILTTAVLLSTGCEPECALVSRDLSPDGRFEIVLCRLEQGSTMPGQSSDAPGRIYLRHRESGRVLRSADVEMIQLMSDVTWSPDRVHVKLVADWELPSQ
jgi:hypothetical protein